MRGCVWYRGVCGIGVCVRVCEGGRGGGIGVCVSSKLCE